MDVKKKAYVQHTLPFKEETVGLCAEAAQVAQEAPSNTDSDRKRGVELAKVSKGEISNNPAEMELKSLLTNLSVLQDSSTSDILNNKDQDYTLIPQIINLNPHLTQGYIAQEIFGTICDGLGVSAEETKTKLENLKSTIPQFSPLKNRAVFAILTRENRNTKPLQDRPSQEEHFNRDFFNNLKFTNKFHALNWVINAEDKLNFFIGKAKKNQISDADFYRYLVLLRRGLEMILKNNQIAKRSNLDGKSASVGGERYWD
jgi:hypothetical protein